MIIMGPDMRVEIGLGLELGPAEAKARDLARRYKRRYVSVDRFGPTGMDCEHGRRIVYRGRRGRVLAEEEEDT